VAYPRDVRDVVAAVRFARDHGVRVASQAGHNVSAYGALDNALLASDPGTGGRQARERSADPAARRTPRASEVDARRSRERATPQ
jgi:hypothetical protein